MDLLFLLLLIGLPLLALLAVGLKVLFWLFVAKKALEVGMGQFQSMTPQQKVDVLARMQQAGQIAQAGQYMNTMQGPVEMEVRGLAAQNGISLDF